MTKSPLRYPGGKSRKLKQILPRIPGGVYEYREPFVGGGSVFLGAKILWPEIQSWWINDLNKDLMAFWFYAQRANDFLCESIYERYRSEVPGQELYNSLKHYSPISRGLAAASRFFILNRITFSGTTESGGFSQQAFNKRFTESSIERIRSLEAALSGIRITDDDYSTLLNREGKNVFIFLDPPYFMAKNLYGKKGNLHSTFDHKQLAAHLRYNQHRWLLTYDDCPEIRSLYEPFANIAGWDVQYSMNNSKKGSELFISNY